MRVRLLTLDPGETRTTGPAGPGMGGTELERARSIARQDPATAACHVPACRKGANGPTTLWVKA
ncbi:MAG: hypothetical protein ACM3ZU_15625 [Bacteroidota bacterium]